MKPLDEAKYLMDITTRQQMYIEGVKLGQRNQFEKVLIELSKELKLILAKVRYQTLDQMTKAELNVLLVTVRRFQSRIYSKYTDTLIGQLQAFMKADVKQTKRMMAYAKRQFSFDEFDDDLELLTTSEGSAILESEREENNFIPLFPTLPRDDSDESFNKFWGTLVASPLPATGALTLPFIKVFTSHSQAAIENLIRQAYVNGWTKDELTAAIVGIQGGDKGALNKILNNADAVTATLFQFVAAAVAAGVSSTAFGYYVWLSVMDNRTSTICRQRNQKVYQYGVGPMPPAHIRCRSHTMPLQGGKLDDRIDTAFYNWASRQPVKFLASVFGASAAASYKNGTASKKDKDGFTAVKPITIQEFENMDELILLKGD